MMYCDIEIKFNLCASGCQYHLLKWALYSLMGLNLDLWLLNTIKIVPLWYKKKYVTWNGLEQTHSLNLSLPENLVNLPHEIPKLISGVVSFLHSRLGALQGVGACAEGSFLFWLGMLGCWWETQHRATYVAQRL